MSLPRIVVSEYLAHRLRRMSAPDQKSIRSRARRAIAERILTEFPVERQASELGVATALQHRRDRRVDDGIGDSPTSQFVCHSEAAVPAPKQQLLGATARQRPVVDVAVVAQREERVRDGGRIETPPYERRLDLDGGARRAREQTDGNVARGRRRARNGRRIRTG